MMIQREKNPVKDPWAFDVALMVRFPETRTADSFPFELVPFDVAARGVSRGADKSDKRDSGCAS